MELIQKALGYAGYEEMDATEDNLIDCFKDYVLTGTWRDIEIEDVEDMTVEEMAKGLLSLR